ncbi:YutD family protein [Levilactobacillus brevis]|nr:YutD family protein [Levilactobacillus brevis]
MTTVDRKDLEALVAQQKETREPAAEVVRVDETHLTINNHPYELVVNVRDGFDFTEFAAPEERSGAKQNQIEAVQDYLYEMCNFGCAYFILHNLDVKTAPKPRRNRRRRNTNGPKVEKTTATAAQPAVKADTAGDKPSHANNNHRRRSRHRRRNTTHPYTEERRTTVKPTSTATKTVTVATGGQGRRHFTIRKKEEE